MYPQQMHMNQYPAAYMGFASGNGGGNNEPQQNFQMPTMPGMPHPMMFMPPMGMPHPYQGQQLPQQQQQYQQAMPGPMMMAPMAAPPQVMTNQQTDRDRSRSPAMPARPSFPDDTGKISTTYKALGMVHIHGEKRCTPKRFRASLRAACNSDEYPMVKVSQLDDECVDLLLFVLSGVLPNTKVSDLGVRMKGEARAAIRQQYLVKLRKNRSRLTILAEELDNLPMVAHRLGYPVHLFSPKLREVWDALKASQGAAYRAAAETLGAASAPADTRSTAAGIVGHAPLAIADGQEGTPTRPSPLPILAATAQEQHTPKAAPALAPQVGLSLPPMRLQVARSPPPPVAPGSPSDMESPAHSEVRRQLIHDFDPLPAVSGTTPSVSESGAAASSAGAPGDDIAAATAAQVSEALELASPTT